MGVLVNVRHTPMRVATQGKFAVAHLASCIMLGHAIDRDTVDTVGMAIKLPSSACACTRPAYRMMRHAAHM